MTHEAGWAHAPGALRGPSWLREPADPNDLVPLLWSSTAHKSDGDLVVGGVAMRDLVAEHQSPAYVLDEADFRARVAAFRDAFGDYDDRLLFLEPRHLFPEHIEEGMGFEGLPEGGNPAAPKDRLYFVSDIYPEHVVLDGNHPLAGIALRITMKVHAVREATLNEIGLGTLGTGFFRMQIDPDQPAGEGEDPSSGSHTLH